MKKECSWASEVCFMDWQTDQKLQFDIHKYCSWGSKSCFWGKYQEHEVPKPESKQQCDQQPASQHAHLSVCSVFPSITSSSSDVGVTRPSCHHRNIVSRWAWPGLRWYIYYIDIYFCLLFKLSVMLSLWGFDSGLISWSQLHRTALETWSNNTQHHGRAAEACVHVWLGCKHRHRTCQRRKPDICHFIITVSLLLSSEEKGQSWTCLWGVNHCVEMNRNAVLIPGLIASYSPNSAVGFHCWMNNCHVEQHVISVRVKWQDGKRKSAWRLDISHQGEVKKKVRSCHVTTNMPLKSFAVSKYTQVSANTPSLVLSQWISEVL